MVNDRQHDVAIATTQKRNVTVLSSLSAGSLSGAVSKAAIAPLERAKFVFICSDERFSYRGMKNVLVQTVKTGGVSHLWAGYSATLVRIVPYAALQYTSHEEYKRLLKKDGETHLPPLRRFVAGSLAGATSTILTYPLDVMRTRLALQPPKENKYYRGLCHGMAKLYQEEGVRALFRGLQATLTGIVPYAGTSFFTFETLKWAILDHTTQDSLTVVQRVMCGATAGLMGQACCYPLEIVRRRSQTAGFFNDRQPMGMLETFKEVLRVQGIRGLYKGLSVNFIKAPIATGISFAMFETSRSFFEDNLNKIL